MTKHIGAALILVLTILATACGGNSPLEPTSAKSGSTPTEDPRVGFRKDITLSSGISLSSEEAKIRERQALKIQAARRRTTLKSEESTLTPNEFKR